MLTGRVYYDLATGAKVTHYTSNQEILWTVDQDFERTHALARLVRETVGVIELHDKQFDQDFQEASNWRVNVTGDEPVIEFTYPVPDDPVAPPTYEPPLSTKVAELEAENVLLKARHAQIQDDQLFILEVLAKSGLL
jgi:hypothetical protein